MQEVDERLAAAEIDFETVTAQTVAIEMDSVERIDRMLTGAEWRRNTVLREIDRHRDAVARRMRDVVDEIEDAEFEDLPTAPR